MRTRICFAEAGGNGGIRERPERHTQQPLARADLLIVRRQEVAQIDVHALRYFYIVRQEESPPCAAVSGTSEDAMVPRWISRCSPAAFGA